MPAIPNAPLNATVLAVAERAASLIIGGWLQDPELPQRVPVLGGPGGAVHPDVAAGAGDVEGLGAAGAGGGGVDGGPVRAVGGGLDLEGPGVGGFPVQRDLADGLGRAEVDFEPLRVGERAGPPGAGV